MLIVGLVLLVIVNVLSHTVGAVVVVIRAKWFWYNAMCLGPFIIVKENAYSQERLNHEYIHFKQQQELLFVGAYLLYAIEFIIKLLYHRSFYAAYLTLSFEREARFFQHIVGYAQHRKMYAQKHLISMKDPTKGMSKAVVVSKKETPKK